MTNERVVAVLAHEIREHPIGPGGRCACGQFVHDGDPDRLARHIAIAQADALARSDLVLAVTLSEAAALLGVTPDNLRGAIARGALKAEKHGRDWWVEPVEVERYRKEHKR